MFDGIGQITHFRRGLLAGLGRRMQQLEPASYSPPSASGTASLAGPSASAQSPFAQALQTAQTPAPAFHMPTLNPLPGPMVGASVSGLSTLDPAQTIASVANKTMGFNMTADELAGAHQLVAESNGGTANSAVMCIIAKVAERDHTSFVDAFNNVVNPYFLANGLALKPGQHVRDTYTELAKNLGVVATLDDFHAATEQLKAAGLPVLAPITQAMGDIEGGGPATNAHP